MSIYSGRSKQSSSSKPSSRVSSILKKPQQSLKSKVTQITNGNSQKVRFTLPHTKKIHTIFKDHIKKENVKEYENLVCLIRDCELTDDDLIAVLKEATSCVSLLNSDLRLFIEALLRLNWIDRRKDVIAEYQSFIVNLISAHNYHAEMIIDKLVLLFLPANSQQPWPDGKPGDDVKDCVHVHSLLNVLLNVVPMCKDILIQSLIANFPYLKKSVHVHEFYLHNLLCVLKYQPIFKSDILHLIFSKLIIMDVNAPKEEIEKNNFDDGEIFQMDEDAKSVKTHTTVTTILPETIHQIGQTLDVCLNRMFSYIYEECHDESGQLDWDKTKIMYQDLLTIFDKIILPTYNIHHVQFVMFVLCNFKTTVCEAFLNYLWKKVCNPNVAPVIRQSAVNYIVSLLARATFVSLITVKGILQQMAEWIHSYINNQDGVECINSDLRVHSVFYTACQGLFYLIAFRHKDLVSSKKNITFLESLNLGKMVTCRLNPLKVCQQAVIQNFAAVTRKYQLAYCYSVIEHNQRSTLRTIYRDEKGSMVVSTGVLEAFYPFDPFILSRSSDKIHPYYRDYQEIDKSDNEDMEGVEDDDFLETNQKFSYGSSPGFKFKN